MEFFFSVFYQPTANILFALIDGAHTDSLVFGILALVILVKIILLPLAVKNTRTQIKMKPILEKIREIQKNTEEKKEQTEKILNLYKKEGVNPFGQIVFLIIQIPIFITIFFVVKDIGEREFSADTLYSFIGHTAVDTGFLFTDLTETGTVGIVLLVGISQFILMYYSQKNMVTASVSKAQKIIFVAVFPLLAAGATVFFVNAVGVYWFFNNIFSILQEVLILNTIRLRENRGAALRSVTGNNHTAAPPNPVP